ncbi:MAG: ski2-type helicase, partial [Candidatus Methanomethylophilaceae archaeon]|nr:ski2-type helicase [Candidatus Methanomethylophilaceae archaeon]
TSKLGNERILRSHLLGLIATGDAESDEEIADFMNDTFYGATFELYGVDRVISNVVDFLAEEEMVERDGDRVRILPFGKRVSDLYIDPWTAVILKKAVLKMDQDTDEMMIMQAISCTPDVMGMYPKKDDIPELESIDMEYDERFLCTIEDECGGTIDEEADWDNHMADLKTALLLVRWISEMSEDGITEVMKIGPGDIRSRVDSADWILYAMNEIALIFNPDASKMIKPLLTRVRYGVKEELIPLVSFRGVGRSRARILFDAGIRGRADITRIEESALAAMPKIGKSLAASLKEQAGYSRETSEDDYRETVDDEMEYMLEKMAAEEEAKNNPQPAEPEPEKKKSSGKTKKSSQSSLDIF